MSTNATLSIVTKTGLVETIYVHWDGFVKGGLGEALAKLYNSRGQIQAIIDEGDHSSILPDGRIENYMDTRDEYCPAQESSSVQQAVNELGHGYNYVWTAKEELICLNRNGKLIDMEVTA